jgi:hypothetical protein
MTNIFDSSAKWLQENKIGIGIFDISDNIKDETLKNSSDNCLDFWINGFNNTLHTPLIERNKDANKLLSWAVNNDLNFIVVGALGITFQDNDKHFFLELQKYFESIDTSKIAILGHILDKKDMFYQLHHQTFIVNIKWWKEQGCPDIGNKTAEQKELPKVIRSIENHHDDYTPLWIKKDNGTEQHKNLKFGWNIISKALDSEYTINSFNKNLRISKRYFYPDVISDKQSHFKLNTKWGDTLGYSYEWLKSNGIAFGVHDCSDDVKDDILLQFSKNIMEHWIVEICNDYSPSLDEEIVAIRKKIRDLFDWAIENKFKYLLVAPIGNTFKYKGQEFFTELKNFFDNSISFVGQHDDVFLINLEWWNEQGKPNIENLSKEWPHKLKNNISRENLFNNDDITSSIHRMTQTNIHFIANTEDPKPISKHAGDFDSIVCTAGGLTPITRAWRSNLKPGGQILVVDTSHLALKYSKDLFDDVVSDKVDITNITKYLKQSMLDYAPDDERWQVADVDIFQSQDNIDKMQELINSFAGDGLLNYVKNILPQLEINWLHEDFFDVERISRRLLNRTKSKDRVLLFFSNVYSYYNTAWVYNFRLREHLYRKLLLNLQTGAPNKFWIQKGKTVTSLEESINFSKKYENRLNKFVNWYK